MHQASLPSGISPPINPQAMLGSAKDQTEAQRGSTLGAAREGTEIIIQADNEQTSMAANNSSRGDATRRPPLTVLFDGACPLCRREIGIYQGLRPLRGTGSVCFADVNDHTVCLPLGTTRQQLLARFHVLGHDGELLSGALAFIALWAALPGWRWLAMIGHVPGAARLMERSYRLFLHCRPALQRWAFRLEQSSLKKPH